MLSLESIFSNSSDIALCAFSFPFPWLRPKFMQYLLRYASPFLLSDIPWSIHLITRLHCSALRHLCLLWRLLTSHSSLLLQRALPPVKPHGISQATISLSLLLTHTSRCKPWESLWGSSATTPLVDFHHRLTACPSYLKTIN